MPSETSGDFAVAPEQANMPTSANSMGKVRSDFINFIIFLWTDPRLNPGEVQTRSLPSAVLCRIAHSVARCVLPGLAETLLQGAPLPIQKDDQLINCDQISDALGLILATHQSFDLRNSRKRLGFVESFNES